MALPKAFKVLTKAEIKHLKEDAGVTTIKAFKETRAFQLEMIAEGKKYGYYNPEPCIHCKHITRKLGLEV